MSRFGSRDNGRLRLNHLESRAITKFSNPERWQTEVVERVYMPDWRDHSSDCLHRSGGRKHSGTTAPKDSFRATVPIAELLLAGLGPPSRAIGRSTVDWGFYSSGIGWGAGAAR